MAVEVIGRAEELRVLDNFLEVADSAAAFVLEGESGIGKSTVWLAGVEVARERGFRVLSCRPAKAERGLAHVGLGDLLEPVLEEVLPELPTPRRRALEGALLLEEVDSRVDPRALGVAVRSAVEAVAAERPVVLAVDDVQWLDPSSAAALAFALRRLDRERVLLLLARHLGGHGGSAELEHVARPEATTRLRIGALSLGAIHRLLHARLARALARPTLLRVYEVSGGNPFYALELARALGPDVDPTQPLPVPETLEELVRARLRRLPDDTRAALALVAAVGRPHCAMLERAGVTEEALEPARLAQVTELDDGHVRFTHPLLASVLEHQHSHTKVRSIHGRLARLVDDPLARARHLALAAEVPDGEVAAEVERAAAIAGERGAPQAAAELGEHALRLTPAADEEEVHRRTIAAARLQLVAGDAARAGRLARELLERPAPGRYIEALLLLSDVEEWIQPEKPESVSRLRDALREADGDLTVKMQIHERLASSGPMLTQEASILELERHARAWLELAQSLGAEAASARAVGALAFIHHKGGKADALALAEEACERARGSGDADALRETSCCRTGILLETGRFHAARGALEALEKDWSSRSELVNAWVFKLRSVLELHAGNFVVGAEYAERARELALQYGNDEPASMWDVAMHAAFRGDFEQARAIAGRGRTARSGLRTACEAVLGLVELWSGDASAASDRFAAAERERLEYGIREPHLFWWRADYAEALLALGRDDEASALLDRWEADAARLGRERVLAQIVRCRGLVAAARGEIADAVSLLERAVERHEALGDRYGCSRALLALGTVRRRARQKRAARDAIEAALAGFEECGSVVWVEKARAELGSIGGRRRAAGLTPAERRVAELVAEGRTNREVAAALFLGERTVATHLSHVYAKLGVRSRTELARTLGPSKVQPI